MTVQEQWARVDVFNMKKFIVLILLFSIFVFASFIYVRFYRGSGLPTRIDVARLPSIGTPERTNAPLNIPFRWQQVPKLPSSASIYSYSENQDLKDLVAATVLPVFPTASLTNEDGAVSFWSAEPYSIFFNSSTGALSVALNPSSDAGNLLPKDRVFSAVSSLFSPLFSLSPVQTSPFVAPGQFAQIQGPVVKEDYSILLLSSSPLLRNSFSSTALSFLLSDDRVLSVDFFIPAFSYEKKADVQILSAEQIPEALQLNKGFLAFVYDNNITTEYDAVPKYSSVVLTGARLGYLKEVTNRLLVPVFVLDGLGVSVGGQQTVQYILRASL